MSDKIKRLNRELVYKGAILDIYKDTMDVGNGKIEEWDFVAHRKGAAPGIAPTQRRSVYAVLAPGVRAESQPSEVQTHDHR